MAKFPDNEDGRILAVLAAYGVVSIEATFDGGGDSGQVDEINIKGIADGTSGGTDWDKIALSAEHKEQLETEASTVGDYISRLVDEVIERTNEDWYNNDGGHGEVEIIPGEGRIHVDMNIRYTESRHEPYDFSVEVEKDFEHG